MQDIMIPLGLLLFIALFAGALIRTGRQQRQAKADVFKHFAERQGLLYRPQDDGSAQRFAQGLDGLGRFTSPSLGEVLPQDVITGEWRQRPVTLFRHRTHFSEGWAREWFAAGVYSNKPIAERCAIQFCRKPGDKDSIYLADPVVKEKRAGNYTLVIRAPQPSQAGMLVQDSELLRLAATAEKLPFRPEIQVRGNRVVAYLADRNATADDPQTLEALLAFSHSLA